jgi:hypothetical protein
MNIPVASEGIKNIWTRMQWSELPKTLPDEATRITIILAQRLTPTYEVLTDTSSMNGGWIQTKFNPGKAHTLPRFKAPRLIKFRDRKTIRMHKFAIKAKFNPDDKEMTELNTGIEEAILFLQKERMADPPDTIRSVGVMSVDFDVEKEVGYIEVKIRFTDAHKIES